MFKKVGLGVAEIGQREIWLWPWEIRRVSQSWNTESNHSATDSLKNPIEHVLCTKCLTCIIHPSLSATCEVVIVSLPLPAYRSRKWSSERLNCLPKDTYLACKQWGRLGLRSTDISTGSLEGRSGVLVLSAGSSTQQAWVQILPLPHTNWQP